MTISNSQKKYLRSLVHHKGVVIWIGQKGLTENVDKEIEAALDHHELIKIKIRCGDRELRETLINQICTEHNAQLVQKTGNIISVFRMNEKNPKISLPA